MRVDRGGHLHGVDRERPGRRRCGPGSGRSRRAGRAGCPASRRGTPMLVRWPSPNFVEVGRSSPRSNLSAASTVPMLEDLRDDAGQGQPDHAVRGTSRGSTRSPRGPAAPGTWSRVRGVTLPASISALSGEHLLDRAGLVDVAHRARRRGRLLGRGQRVVRVERRVVGQREDLAGAGVHAPPRSRSRRGRPATGLAQHPLGVPLQVPVDGRVQVRAVDRPGRSVLSPSGIRLPPPTSYVAEPSVPASCVSKVRSRPASGSSVPMKPIRLAATSPAG